MRFRTQYGTKPINKDEEIKKINDSLEKKLYRDTYSAICNLYLHEVTLTNQEIENLTLNILSREIPVITVVNHGKTYTTSYRPLILASLLALNDCSNKSNILALLNQLNSKTDKNNNKIVINKATLADFQTQVETRLGRVYRDSTMIFLTIGSTSAVTILSLLLMTQSILCLCGLNLIVGITLMSSGGAIIIPVLIFSSLLLIHHMNKLKEAAEFVQAAQNKFQEIKITHGFEKKTDPFTTKQSTLSEGQLYLLLQPAKPCPLSDATPVFFPSIPVSQPTSPQTIVSEGQLYLLLQPAEPCPLSDATPVFFPSIPVSQPTSPQTIVSEGQLYLLLQPAEPCPLYDATPVFFPSIPVSQPTSPQTIVSEDQHYLPLPSAEPRPLSHATPVFFPSIPVSQPTSPQTIVSKDQHYLPLPSAEPRPLSEVFFPSIPASQPTRSDNSNLRTMSLVTS